MASERTYTKGSWHVVQGLEKGSLSIYVPRMNEDGRTQYSPLTIERRVYCSPGDGRAAKNLSNWDMALVAYASRMYEMLQRAVPHDHVEARLLLKNIEREARGLEPIAS